MVKIIPVTSLMLYVVIFSINAEAQWAPAKPGSYPYSNLTPSRPKPVSGEEGVLDKISRGVKMAGQYFGLDSSSIDVAKLVSAAFGGVQKKAKQQDDKKPSFFSGLLRMFALDYSKIAAIPLNAFIFFAQMINNTLMFLRPSLTLPDGSVKDRQVRRGSPFNWIRENPSKSLANLITLATDKNLTNKIIETINEKSGSEDTSCIQLLVCKSAPFIWKMQKTIADAKLKFESSDKKFTMYRHLPEISEFDRNGDECERRLPTCQLF